MNSTSHAGDLSALPSDIRWQSSFAGEAETKEFILSDDPGHHLKVRTPWWLSVVVGDGSLNLTPKVCGTFSGKLVVRCGQDRRVIRVESSIVAGPANRWAGAGIALASALGGSVFVFCLCALFLEFYFIGILVFFFVLYTTPCLQICAWSGLVGGKRFLLRAILGWLVAMGAFLGIAFLLSKLDIPDVRFESQEYLDWRHFALLGPTGGVAMALWAWCVAGRKLVLPSFVAGLFYPFAVVFTSHWAKVIGLPHPHILDNALFCAGLVLPILFFAPWIGSRLPPAGLPTVGLKKRTVITTMSGLVCLMFALSYVYNLQKPSALTITRTPLHSKIALAKLERSPMPGETLWQIEVSRNWQSRRIVTTNDLGEIIVFFGGSIYVVQPVRDTYSEIDGNLFGIGALAVGKNRTIYFSSNGFIFAFRNGKKLWSWGSDNRFYDLLLQPDESITCIGESQIVSLDKKGRKQWTYPESKKGFLFFRAFTDHSNIIYVLNWDGHVFAFNLSGELLWKREPEVAGHYYVGDYNLHPESACLMAAPTPLLVIGSTNGVIAWNSIGRTQFISQEPFELFDCDNSFCYGIVDQHSIYKLDKTGVRQLLYRSPEPLVGCLLQASEGMIYVLTKGMISRLRLNGELEGSIPVSENLESLVAVHGDRIYGKTETSVVAMQGLVKPRR